MVTLPPTEQLLSQTHLLTRAAATDQSLVHYMCVGVWHDEQFSMFTMVTLSIEDISTLDLHADSVILAEHPMYQTRFLLHLITIPTLMISGIRIGVQHMWMTN